MICRRWVWGGMKSDDICCMGCDVPMWVRIDGAMLGPRGVLWVFF